MEFNYAKALTATLTLFAVIDILGSIPVFISLKKKLGEIHSLTATVVSGALMLMFFFIGEEILSLVGIDVSSFAIAGSIVIFVIALEMVLGHELFKNEGSAKSGSIVPIAFPMIAGSGTLTTIISMKGSYGNTNVLIGILVNLVVIYIILRSVDWLERVLSSSFLFAARKFFGVILLAIAIKIFRDNMFNF
jgi:multiple antibiotic resistance protein